jgi:hypothetical protein
MRNTVKDLSNKIRKTPTKKEHQVDQHHDLNPTGKARRKPKLHTKKPQKKSQAEIETPPLKEEKQE